MKKVYSGKNKGKDRDKEIIDIKRIASAKRIAIAAILVLALVCVCACANDTPSTDNAGSLPSDGATTQATGENDGGDAAENSDSGGSGGNTGAESVTAGSAASDDNSNQDTVSGGEGGGEPVAPTQSGGSPAVPSLGQDAGSGSNDAVPVDVTTTEVSQTSASVSSEGSSEVSAEAPTNTSEDGATTASLVTKTETVPTTTPAEETSTEVPSTAQSVPADAGGSTDTNTSASDVYAAIAGAATPPEMFQVPDDLIMDFYGINSADYSSAVFMLCADSLLADEFVIVRAVDQAAADRLYTQLEARMSIKADEARTYSPEQFAVIDSCSVSKDGLWVALIVSPDATAFRGAYSAAIT